jgi:hypothetical protein
MLKAQTTGNGCCKGGGEQNVEWKQITQEEAKGLNYSSRTGKESPYKAILDAVEKGPVQVNISEDVSLQSLKWALQRRIKSSGAKIAMSTLADRSGVVLTKIAPEPPKK